MPSHLSSVGLPVGSEAEFWDLAQRVGPLAVGVPVDGGTYFHWRDGSGAELWLQVTAADQFVGMHPHFSGESRVPARLVERVPSADGEFDGAYHAAAGATDDTPGGLYPFRFDSPEFRRLDRLPADADVVLQVAAFAHELEVFDTEAEFTAAMADEGTPDLESRYFRASGLVDVPAGELPESRAVFTGVVLASAEKANGLTGRRFYWVLAETPGGTFDVVADPALMPHGPPPAGAVVSGSFWLSGRVRAD